MSPDLKISEADAVSSSTPVVVKRIPFVKLSPQDSAYIKCINLNTALFMFTCIHTCGYYPAQEIERCQPSTFIGPISLGVIWPVLELHVSRIIQYVPFCIWPPSLGTVSTRLMLQMSATCSLSSCAVFHAQVDTRCLSFMLLMACFNLVLF